MTTPMATRQTGLPPGVETAPAGRRFVAYLIDHCVPAVLGAVAVGIAAGSDLGGNALLALILVVTIVSLAWGVVVWWMYARRAAGPGMRVMKLQLVGYRDGRPIGWGRFLLRWLVLSLVSATGVGLIVMLLVTMRQVRRQGWHDLAAESVVIVERQLAPAATGTATRSTRSPALDPAQTPRTTSAPAAPEESAAGTPASGTRPAPDPQPAPVAAAQSSNTPASTPGTTGPDDVPADASALTPAGVAAQTPASPRTLPNNPVDADWVLVFDDGWDLTVDGLILLGRNPVPEPGEEGAHLIKMADTTRTVSKTHLAVGVDPNGLYVMDRGSTNGSTVTTADGFSLRCTPGDVIAVTEGSIVSLGDHWFRVDRG